MCFLGWSKVRLDAEVQLQRATLKPGTATSREILGFGNFSQPEQLAIKPARQGFTTDRYGQLNVIDAVNGHLASSINVSS